MRIEVLPAKPVGCTHIYLDEDEDAITVLKAIAKAIFEISYPADWKPDVDRDVVVDGDRILIKPFENGDTLEDEEIDKFIAASEPFEPHTVVLAMEEVKGRQCAAIMWCDKDDDPKHLWFNDYWYYMNHFYLPTDQVFERAQEILENIEDN